MAVQILAVQLDPKETDGTHNIIEIIWRQDDTGKTGALNRRDFVKWMTENPADIVYVRNSYGQVTQVFWFSENNDTFLRTVTDGSRRDDLLMLPRYVTPTK